MKNKIAIFDLTGCEGCEFHMLSLNELLLDIFQDFEVTNWRLLSEEDRRDFDIAFIEGAATTQQHIQLLKEIRETSKIVVAIGSCAINGNVFAKLSPEQREKLAPKIYDKDYKLKAKFVDPVEKYIKVDYKVPGCAPNLEIFKKLLQEFKGKEITSEIKEVSPPDYVAKIEGHGRLSINFENKQTKFEVEESERLIEGLVLGNNFKQAPFINARICGICPVAHNLCSWKAIENALNIELTEESTILREIILIAQIIKSHLLHLFFLVLPDYVGVRSSIELSTKYPAEFHLMLNIKRVSEKALQVIMGSTAFPVFTTLGGFTKVPELDGLRQIQDDIYDVLDESQDLVNLFGSFDYFPLETKIGFITMEISSDKYPLYRGEFNQSIKEIVSHTSTAKLGVLENGEIVKTGAMARIDKYGDHLNKQAKMFLNKFKPGMHNPFNNNLAQAIEILHYLEEMSIKLDKIVKRDLGKAKAQVDLQLPQDSASGKACLEAPRGVLIHEVTVNNKGEIVRYNLIPPTQINLASVQKEAEMLVHNTVDVDEKDVKREVEKLIRAFDPCITCAVH